MTTPVLREGWQSHEELQTKSTLGRKEPEEQRVVQLVRVFCGSSAPHMQLAVRDNPGLCTLLCLQWVQCEQSFKNPPLWQTVTTALLQFSSNTLPTTTTISLHLLALSFIILFAIVEKEKRTSTIVTEGVTYPEINLPLWLQWHKIQENIWLQTCCWITFLHDKICYCFSLVQLQEQISN